MFPERRRTTLMLRRRTSIKDDSFFVLNKYIAELRSLQPNRNSISANAAAVWERKSNGYRIIDLRLDRFMEALRFIINQFFQTEPMCRATELYDDAVSVRMYLRMLFSKMSDMHSFCAIREGTGDLVGILVASIIPRGNQIELQSHEGEALYRLMTLKNYAVCKTEFYKALNAERFVRIDALCVDSNHQKMGVGTALVRSCVALAAELLVPACVGEFTSGASRTIAERLGFGVLSEIPYKDLKLERSKYQIFENCGSGNYSIACMGLPIMLPEIQPLATPISASTVKSERKSERTKKKKHKNK